MMPTKNTFWRDRPVFVTGCTGLLGSWLTEALIGKEACVTGLIRDYVPSSNLVRSGMHSRINVVRGELEDFALIQRVLNEYEIDTVFHLGAQTIVPIANMNPLSTFEANIKGSWNLLEACRRVPRVKRIIVASSDKAYGEHSRLPYTEQTPLKGAHPYDVSKSCADLLAQSFHATYGLPVCVTRCGNLYGGGDINFNRIIPGTIRSVIRDESPIIRSDGKFVRDYFYVKDAVEALLLLGEKIESNSVRGEPFNFSNEDPMTVIEVVRIILKLMGRTDLKPRILNEASGEIRAQYLSAVKARKVLGWKPRYSMAQGLKETIAWYREFFEHAEF